MQSKLADVAAKLERERDRDRKGECGDVYGSTKLSIEAEEREGLTNEDKL